jgi:hypothetical protein
MLFPLIGRNTVYERSVWLILLATLSLGAPAQMYRWVDGQGKVHYTDTPPPQSAKMGTTELSKSGVALKTHASQADIRASEQTRADAANAAREVEARQRLDRALLATYTSPQEIDLARDRALEHHDLQIRGAELRLAQVQKNLDELNTRAGKLQHAGKAVPPFMQKELLAAEAETLELRRAILKNEDAKQQVRRKYESDRLRFAELTGKR